MFKRRQNDTNMVFSYNGKSVPFTSGDSVAAALLATNTKYTRRTPKRGAPRLPFCMMGVCFECIMEINGIANQQACMTKARPGMEVRKQEVILGSDWS